MPGNISAEIPFVFEMRITGDIPAEISDAVFFDAAVSGVSRAGSSTKAVAINTLGSDPDTLCAHAGDGNNN